MADVELIGIYKSYKNRESVVKDFNLEIRDGEFIVLVGPSGCGKSTVLRMIAGLEEITAGELQIDGRTVNHLEPRERNLSMVFQNYALYPYMNVYENMAFSLRCAKMDRGEIDRRVKAAASLLQIGHLLDRRPGALSGGQKQRVAIGSLLVKESKLYLMDEPLSNLDAKLRTQMRVELAKIHRNTGATIIYVTHDQVEAMTLGDRIVVMRAGEIQQAAPPGELYNNPVNQFVAGFIGSPSMNFLPVQVCCRETGTFLLLGENRLPVTGFLERRLKTCGYAGRHVTLGIRPEDLYDSGREDCRFPMKVLVREGLGAEVLLHGEVCGEQVCVRMPPGHPAGPGETIWLYPEMMRAKVFDSDSGKNLTYIGV